MGRYRVFISYSHEDLHVVEMIVDILRDNGLIPMWDRDFSYGHGFPELIKDYISHSHVFMPVITNASCQRGWVHQEIGYAIAMHIPVLPLAIGRVPGEMLQDLTAVRWTEDQDVIRRRLCFDTFDSLVRTAQRVASPLYVCARYHEERTMMMAEYAQKVLQLKAHGHVRQKGALSSFHIPANPVSDPVWQKRYGAFTASEFRCNLLRQERLVLEEHARECGCSLIINPYLSYEKYGNEARRARLKTLLGFLESMPDEKVRVAIHQGLPTEENLTIVGDWFAAEAFKAALGSGYSQTMFTRHAPTIEGLIDSFDQELSGHLRERGIDPDGSKMAAVEEIKMILVEMGDRRES